MNTHQRDLLTVWLGHHFEGRGRQDLLAKLRFFILYLVLAATVFEWQFVAAKQYGSEAGGAMLGVAGSSGTLATVAGLALMSSFRRPLSISRTPGLLLVLNAAFGWQIASTWGLTSYSKHLMLATMTLMASLFLINNSIEIASVQGSPDLKYPRIRAFGSYGYLAGAFLSQAFPGSLSLVILSLNVALLLLPMVTKTNQNGTQNFRQQADKDSHRNATWAIAISAFSIAFIAKGFEVIGPLHLRTTTQDGLRWLAVLIFFEALFLRFLHLTNTRAAILAAPLMWSCCYALFLAGLSPLAIFFAMFFAAGNCLAQTTLQSLVGQLYSGSPTAQAFLSSCNAIGGFIASLVLAASINSDRVGILGVSLIASLFAIPVVLTTIRRIPVG